MTNKTLNRDHTCPVCQASQAEVFFELPEAPVICNVLWPTRAQAISVPRVKLPLAFCRCCGHIFNPSFDPSLLAYTEAYENSLHFSPRFQQYAESLAQRLVTRHQLYDKDIIEIGGGQGDFLKLLCRLGGNRGLSIDPSYVPTPDEPPTVEQIIFIRDNYGTHHAGLPADFVCSRHTLEHIQRPVELMNMVRHTLGKQFEGIVFVEVPNALFTLHDLAIWDVIYEHCSYFTPQSLAYLFSACGFWIQTIRETFAGQFLCIEATAAPSAAGMPEQDRDTLDALACDVAAFAWRYRQKLRHDQTALADMQRAGKTAVVWGAGSKGITFLNTLQLQDQIEYAVDINPRKQGMHITGTGQKIVPPAFLQEYRPDVVLVTNPVYLDEIRQTLGNLGLTVEFLLI